MSERSLLYTIFVGGRVITAKRKLSIIAAVVALVMIGLALTFITFLAVTPSQTGSSTSTVPVPPSQTGSSNGGGAIITYQTLSSTDGVSTSANLAVYNDSACTIPLDSINWGTLTIGGTSTQTIYVKNNSSDLSLTLNMTTSSWSPTSANGPITITWNPQSTDLQPGASVAATLTLTVSSSIVDITSFSVQINIGGTNP